MSLYLFQNYWDIFSGWDIPTVSCELDIAHVSVMARVECTVLNGKHCQWYTEWHTGMFPQCNDPSLVPLLNWYAQWNVLLMMMIPLLQPNTMHTIRILHTAHA